MHVVWMQAEDTAVRSPFSSPPTSTYLCPSPSAVGIYLERFSVEPAATTAVPGSALGGSPARGGSGVTSGYTSPKGGGSRSPKGSSTGAGGGSHSPKAGSAKVSTPSSTERAKVKKEISLVGLSAYTKESTADWRKSAADGSADGGHAIRPEPPVRESAPASPTHSAAGAARASTGSMREGKGMPFTGPCKTNPVYILRPVGARGTLMIHEGVTGQAVPPSSGDTGRPATGGLEEGSASVERRGAAAGWGIGGGGSGAEPPPLTAVSLDVDAIAVQVNVRQYAVLNEAVSALAMSQRRFRFRRERPTTAVLEDPEAWWRYAIK